MNHAYSVTHESMYADMRAEMLLSATLTDETRAWLLHIGDRCEYAWRDCVALDEAFGAYGDEGVLE